MYHFRYYKALTVMETRFPISKDKGHVMLSFTWYDAFRASKRAEQYSIHFEKAAVMFNLGAVLTQQALACDRTQDQGMKDAAKKFQVYLQATPPAQTLYALTLCNHRSFAGASHASAFIYFHCS